MRSKWIETTIGEQVTLQRGIDITKETQRPGTVPVVSSGGVSSFHDTSAVFGPGVVLGRKGVVGSVFYIESDYWPHDTTLWVKDFHGNDPRFVYYFFRWFAPELATMDVGSANPTLNRNHVHPIKVSWPPVPEQRRIAGILGALDDKIELNRRISQTLESMARAIFKSWFIDFDPVRAKAEGRDPEFPGPLTDLVPRSFADSELGEIPSGWRVCGLDEIADFLNGLALQRFPANNGRALPAIKIAQLHAGNTAGADQVSADIPSDYVVQDGDVLFSWSGSLAVELWCGGPGALNQHLFKVTSRYFPKWFYYQWTCQHLSDFAEIAAAKATTMGHIQRGHLGAAKVVVPSPAVLGAMTDLFQPLLDELVAIRLQSRMLAETADALLPRLVSGGQSFVSGGR
jgi:type I restriction enzyme, S subunit